MRRALPLLLGVATAIVVAYAVPNLLYERRVILPSSDVEAWIERDGCDVVAGTSRVAYARCPRLRLP